MGLWALADLGLRVWVDWLTLYLLASLWERSGQPPYRLACDLTSDWSWNYTSLGYRLRQGSESSAGHVAP